MVGWQWQGCALSRHKNQHRAAGTGCSPWKEGEMRHPRLACAAWSWVSGDKWSLSHPEVLALAPLEGNQRFSQAAQMMLGGKKKRVYMMRDKISRRGCWKWQLGIYFTKFWTSQVVFESVTNLVSVQCKVLRSVLEWVKPFWLPRLWAWCLAGNSLCSGTDNGAGFAKEKTKDLNAAFLASFKRKQRGEEEQHCRCEQR